IRRGFTLRSESLKQRSDQMDLTLSDEQRLLRESVDRFIAETYDADHRRRVASDPLGFSPEIWKQFAALGWLALPIEEAYGGLGGGAGRPCSAPDHRLRSPPQRQWRARSTVSVSGATGRGRS